MGLRAKGHTDRQKYPVTMVPGTLRQLKARTKVPNGWSSPFHYPFRQQVLIILWSASCYDTIFWLSIGHDITQHPYWCWAYGWLHLDFHVTDHGHLQIIHLVRLLSLHQAGTISQFVKRLYIPCNAKDDLGVQGHYLPQRGAFHPGNWGRLELFFLGPGLEPRNSINGMPFLALEAAGLRQDQKCPS